MSDEAQTYPVAWIYTFDRNDRVISRSRATSEELRELEAQWPMVEDVPLREGSPAGDGPYGSPGVITYTYYADAPPRPRIAFERDPAARVLRLTTADGTVEVFRDIPTRYLYVEPDPESGEMRPVVKLARPVYLYLCREEREVR